MKIHLTYELAKKIAKTTLKKYFINVANVEEIGPNADSVLFRVDHRVKRFIIDKLVTFLAFLLFFFLEIAPTTTVTPFC